MHELPQGWRAAVADDDLRRVYHGDGFDDTGWEPIAVPGHWRSTPAFADSDGPLLYRCAFGAAAPPPGRRAWLTFDGLFYQGDVWLDGGYLGDTEGYFLPHTFEVTDQLRGRAEHVLAVEAACAAEQPGTPKRNLTGAFQASSYLDPTWNPGGIWRPVRLDETGPVRIAGLRVVCREASPERAVVALRATLDSDAPRTVRLRSELGALDHEQTHPLAAGENTLEWTVTVERPDLWWPRALGDPVLHDVTVAVRLDDPPADEQGLLLWQDMPLLGGYARGVRRAAARQAREAVDLLGHHPSIAVWCGHDEPVPVDAPLWAQQVPRWNRTVLDASVKRALERADGSRPAVAHSGVLPHPPQLEGTDSHLWFGWHRGDERDLAGFARALPRMVRFVGAFGAQAVPSADATGDGAAFCQPDRWPDLDWDRLAERHNLQKERLDRYVPPAAHADFDDWRTATQRYQAELIRRHVETLRRLKYRPTGGLGGFFLGARAPR